MAFQQYFDKFAINFSGQMIFPSGINYNYASGAIAQHRTALKFIQLTPSDYANLGTYDSETLYIVTE